jgi:asparagine synthase (glutamine-hydrolysing)
MKIHNNSGKWILRQLLNEYVPRDLIERPKLGFGLPVGDWLRDPLREWAEDLLDEKKMNQEGYFNTGLIQKIWKEHLSKKYDWTEFLWSILMFQSWLKAEKDL